MVVVMCYLFITTLTIFSLMCFVHVPRRQRPLDWHHSMAQFWCKNAISPGTGIIFIMGIPVLMRQHLYIEISPCVLVLDKHQSCGLRPLGCSLLLWVFAVAWCYSKGPGALMARAYCENSRRQSFRPISGSKRPSCMHSTNIHEWVCDE